MNLCWSLAEKPPIARAGSAIVGVVSVPPPLLDVVCTAWATFATSVVILLGVLQKIHSVFVVSPRGKTLPKARDRYDL